MSNCIEPSGKIVGVFIGRVENLWPGKAPSAISKRPTDQAVHIGTEGISGDHQADRKVHGGPEKAIHHYASEHMQYWKDTFPGCASQFKPGCFGENISSIGLDENNLCLGDILNLGSAKVQVCQGRHPCWKLNSHTGLKAMAAQFQKSGRTGWYYRVLEPGAGQVGDKIKLIDRCHPDWPLRRLIGARFDPRLGVSIANELSKIEVLSLSWRHAFAKKVVGST